VLTIAIVDVGGFWSRMTQPSRPMITIGATNISASVR